MFDNGYFSEFATFSFSDLLAQTPREIVAKSLNVPVSDLINLPKDEVYIAQGPPPPSLPVNPISGPGDEFQLAEGHHRQAAQETGIHHLGRQKPAIQRLLLEPWGNWRNPDTPKKKNPSGGMPGLRVLSCRENPLWVS